MGLIPAAILYLKWISNLNNELESNTNNPNSKQELEHMSNMKKTNNYGYYLNPTLMLTSDSKSNNGIELQSMYPEGKLLIPSITRNINTSSNNKSEENALNSKSSLSDEITNTNTSEPKKGTGKPKWLKI